jgi:hypothetical protein
VLPSCLPQNPSRARVGDRRRCRHSPVCCPSPVRTPVLRLSVCLPAHLYYAPDPELVMVLFTVSMPAVNCLHSAFASRCEVL